MVSQAKARQGSADRRTRIALLALCTALPMLFVSWNILQFTTNMPYLDDFEAILGFANHMHQLATPVERLQFFFAVQNLDYKFIFMHTVVLMQLALVHHVDLYALSLIGDLFLVLILVVQWRTHFTDERDLARRLLLFLPIVLLFANLNYAEGVDWASASLMYQPVIFFSLLALDLLCRSQTRAQSGTQPRTQSAPARRWAFALACVAALLAYFTALNAFLIGPLGLVYLLVDTRSARRESPAGSARLKAGIWCAVFALGLTPYLYHYARSSSVNSVDPWKMPLFFISFLGSGAATFSFASAAGLAIFVVFVLSLRTGYWRTHPSAVLSMAFLLGSAALVTLGRSHQGVASAQVSRYRFFSDLCLVFVYGYLAQRVRAGSFSIPARRGLYAAALALSLVVCIRGDRVGLILLHNQRQARERAAAFYWADPAAHSPMHNGDPAVDRPMAQREAGAKTALEESTRLGLYALPNRPGSQP